MTMVPDMTDPVEAARTHLVEMEDLLFEARTAAVPDHDEIARLEAGFEEAEHDYWEAVDLAVDAEMANLERMTEMGLKLW